MNCLFLLFLPSQGYKAICTSAYLLLYHSFIFTNRKNYLQIEFFTILLYNKKSGTGLISYEKGEFHGQNTRN